MAYTCPICGYPDLGQDPRFASASTLSCPSCGFEFGITDDAHFISYEQYRDEWIADGMPWRGFSPKMPTSWNPAAQIQNAIWTSVPMFFPQKTPKPDDWMTLWIGASPTLSEEPTILMAFLEDVLDVIRPYGNVRIETDEPCIYRDTERGRNALLDAITCGNATRIDMQFGAWSDPPGHGYVTVRLGHIASGGMASHISLAVYPNSHDPIPVPMDRCVGLIRRWFVPLRCAAAAITHAACGTGNEGKLYLTQREREHGKLETWEAIRRYVRGTFWGTALGPDHCARLGGQQRVLREAPVVIAQVLGDGVWLQLSEQPGASLGAVEQLARYLAPLQRWPVEEATIYRRHRVPVVERRANRYYPRAAHTEATHATTPPPIPDGNGAVSVPVAILPRPMWGGTIGINVHLASPPTQAQLGDLQTTMETWYRRHVCDGNERFWPYGYFLDGPTVSGVVARWNAGGMRSFGRIMSWNPLWPDKLREIVQPLSDQFGLLESVNVVEIVVGTETVP